MHNSRYKHARTTLSHKKVPIPLRSRSRGNEQQMSILDLSGYRTLSIKASIYSRAYWRTMITVGWRSLTKVLLTWSIFMFLRERPYRPEELRMATHSLSNDQSFIWWWCQIFNIPGSFPFHITVERCWCCRVKTLENRGWDTKYAIVGTPSTDI